ncbi:MAG: type I glutamate--ammonia ligase [Pyrodictiaceae archaeon]
MSMYLQVQYTDLIGVLRSLTVLIDGDELTRERVASMRIFFDGSSVYGFSDIENSDLELRPIPETLVTVPWDDNVYSVFAGVYTGSMRHQHDPRYIAERSLEHLSSEGYKPLMGVEVEFFLLDELRVEFAATRQLLEVKSRESPYEANVAIPPKKAYHVSEPADRVAPVLREIVASLEAQGFSSRKIHHEVASGGQVEVSSATYDPARLGDYVQTLKKTAKTIARSKGMEAVFLAKPIPGDNGNGMHVHISLWRDGSNLFADPDDEHGISKLARYFIGGLIEHGESLSAFTSPTVNSYKRLVPGYEAPIYLTWGPANRSTAIRVPRVDSEKKVRVEYRPPDPTANPYLAFAAILLAGLDGIKKRIEPPPPVYENVYHWSEKRIRENGFKRLPKSLWDALDSLESDNEYLRPVFPRSLIETYIELKRREVLEVEYVPTPAEYYYYAAIL